MADLYQELVQNAYGHATDLDSLSNVQADKIVRLLEQMRKDINKQLRNIDPTEPLRANAKRKRLEKLLEIANTDIKEFFREIRKNQSSYIAGVAEVENDFVINTTNETLGANVLRLPLTTTQLKVLTDDQLIEGLTNREWWNIKQPDLLSDKLLEQLRIGVSENETINQLSKRVNDATEISKNQARTIVRTTTNAISNTVREEVYAKNDDVIAGQRQISTLDLRTSSICIRRDNLAWDNNKKPIGGHGVPYKPLPLHFNCRSTWTPVFKDLKKITGVDTSGWSAGTRATMNGQLDAKITYAQWFKTLPKEDQIKKLGPNRFRLFEKDKLDIRDFSTRGGEKITLEVLKDKNQTGTIKKTKQKKGKIATKNLRNEISGEDVRERKRRLMKAAQKIKRKIKNNKLEGKA